MVERHPDNVAAALYGGFVGSFLRTLDPKDTARKEIPLSEVLPEPAGGLDTGLRVQEPPVGIGSYHEFRWTPEIKALVVIPDFKVDTAKARGVLPLKYSREDAIFNNQRSSLLPVLLSESPPNATKISEAMRDRMHQPYRQSLVPGLSEILDNLRPSHPGLLGVCLSGAGPTILALATHNFEAIAEAIIAILTKAQDIQCQWQVLEPAEGGAMVERNN
ncbi:hypothetical protein OEA41_004795 [Lepraria neglecta]|uniref:GHMP kinase C-terminal domain-containing protein n=1 Tax=Lepraria neglecta TaxID=209136 RepID=A0AAD9Z0N4_9LECA|nr:hypothetical protein OEA41_004795 [Lepraria neglecta]